MHIISDLTQLETLRQRLDIRSDWRGDAQILVVRDVESGLETGKPRAYTVRIGTGDEPVAEIGLLELLQIATQAEGHLAQLRGRLEAIGVLASHSCSPENAQPTTVHHCAPRAAEPAETETPNEPSPPRSAEMQERWSRLSRREVDVVRMLMRGDRVPAIASDLFVSQSTVRNHLSSVFRKMRVSTQQELIFLLRGDSEDSELPNSDGARRR